VRRELAIAVDDWPAPLDGLRIAFLSDIHVGSPHVPLARLAEIVREVNALRPDLVLLGGDYLVAHMPGGRFISAEKVVDELARLRAPLGVFAVLGNHDRRAGRAPASLAAFERGHPRLIENAAVRLARGDAAFWLVGLSDYRRGTPEVLSTLAQVDDPAPIVALTHNPDLFPDLPDRIALTLAGHTHHGQVRLPLLGAPYASSRFGQRYARGLIREGAKQLYVGAGIGTSLLPVRFLAPPEIAVLTLDASVRRSGA
jgi:predicted MPP superfamily phosphohydrolase